MPTHQFRVTVEDLVKGTKQVMEFAPGDYVLIPFEPCYRAGVQAYPGSGIHVITVNGHRPAVSPRDVTDEPTATPTPRS